MLYPISLYTKSYIKLMRFMLIRVIHNYDLVFSMFENMAEEFNNDSEKFNPYTIMRKWKICELLNITDEELRKYFPSHPNELAVITMLLGSELVDRENICTKGTIYLLKTKIELKKMLREFEKNGR